MLSEGTKIEAVVMARGHAERCLDRIEEAEDGPSMAQATSKIRQATVGDLELLVPLFDAYRVFYRGASDPAGARRFLLERFEHNQSIVFLAFDGEEAVGFTQLYPSFSSVSMRRIWILNDLFVAPEARCGGVGSALLRAAADYGRRTEAVRLTLSTEVTNETAQRVYEREGWVKDTAFYSYDLTL